jgi:hypothetical protein
VAQKEITTQGSQQRKKSSDAIQEGVGILLGGVAMQLLVGVACLGGSGESTWNELTRQGPRVVDVHDLIYVSHTLVFGPAHSPLFCCTTR